MKQLLLVCGAAAISIYSATARQPEAYLNPRWSGSAIDAKGVKHEAASYPGSRPPWALDQVNAVGPEYPYADRSQRHEGRGVFQLMLDLKSGAVVKVAVIKSTGFVTLDRSAAAALRQWRWPPGKWKEITMPITFTMSPASVAVPKDARLLPPVRY
jgi:TonB family protein